MKAARIHNFGGPEVIVVEDVPRPVPATGEVLVCVAAAGVGPWDALIRKGKSKVSHHRRSHSVRIYPVWYMKLDQVLASSKKVMKFTA
jgi:NADPH:quinone reductase-like Zn-dependent oxidoreductase